MTSRMKFFTSLEEFTKMVQPLVKGQDISSILSLDFPFFDKQPKVTLISVPVYDSSVSQSILAITKKEIYVYAHSCPVLDKKEYGEILKMPHGESTVVSLLVLREIIKNYSEEFASIRSVMNTLDYDPILDKIEDSGRRLRKLTDRCEELVKLIITLKEREIKEFDTTLISFDYEILNTEARYWLERCRSHVYRIASLRTKSEMKSNKELNDTMHRLTVIVTFLTIISIVVSVPGTIGAIFGIPALSDAYFKGHAALLVFSLFMLTLGSMALGYLYWTSLGLRYKR